jgi:hypothetical protein
LEIVAAPFLLVPEAKVRVERRAVLANMTSRENIPAVW